MTKKFVRIVNVVYDEVETEKFAVEEFDVTYDARGVLTIDRIIHNVVLKVMYGPDTWKYVELTEEPDEQEEAGGDNRRNDSYAGATDVGGGNRSSEKEAE